VRLAFSGVGGGPVRAREAEAFMAGNDARDPRVLEEAGRIAAEPLEPHSDVHATAAYRKKVAAILAARALERAVDQGGSR
jgi:carbon-monoxide dehydrogenase medium subunit